MVSFMGVQASVLSTVCVRHTHTGTGTSRCIQEYLINFDICMALHGKALGRQQGLHGAFKCTS